MNIEHLKLILDAVNGVSDGAVYIAILWLGVEYLKAILVAGVIVLLIMVAKKLITMALTTQTLISTLQAKIGEVGYLSDRVKERIAQLIDLGLEAEKLKEGGKP